MSYELDIINENKIIANERPNVKIPIRKNQRKHYLLMRESDSERINGGYQTRWNEFEILDQEKYRESSAW